MVEILEVITSAVSGEAKKGFERDVKFSFTFGLTK